jgi:hypothetical protein
VRIARDEDEHVRPLRGELAVLAETLAVRLHLPGPARVVRLRHALRHPGPVPEVRVPVVHVVASDREEVLRALLVERLAHDLRRRSLAFRRVEAARFHAPDERPQLAPFALIEQVHVVRSGSQNARGEQQHDDREGDACCELGAGDAQADMLGCRTER